MQSYNRSELKNALVNIAKIYRGKQDSPMQIVISLVNKITLVIFTHNINSLT